MDISKQPCKGTSERGRRRPRSRLGREEAWPPPPRPQAPRPTKAGASGGSGEWRRQQLGAYEEGQAGCEEKVASKTASTQEEKAGLRRIRERRNEHVNLLAKQLQEEANNEDADDHAAGKASSLKDAKQLLLQEDADAQGGSDDGDSDASLNNGDRSGAARPGYI